MPDKLGVKLFSEKQTKFDFLLRKYFTYVNQSTILWSYEIKVSIDQ